MKLLVYSAKAFEIPFLKKANNNKHAIRFTETSLNSDTAMQAVGFDAISIFSGDDASNIVLEKLSAFGVRFIAIRATGYNNINIKTASRLAIRVANAPNYSPQAIAEHAVALLLALNRKIILADQQVHNYNFSLDKLTAVNLYGKTMGIIGTGNIGSVMARIMHGFSCELLAYDLEPNRELAAAYKLRYVDLDEVCQQSDFISLHIPLTQENHALINEDRLNSMKETVILINTARGAIVDHKALLKALKLGRIGAYGADVYIRERELFFRDRSKIGINDPMLEELLSYDKVLLTPHQGFVTEEALERIAMITVANLDEWEQLNSCSNEIGMTSIPL